MVFCSLLLCSAYIQRILMKKGAPTMKDLQKGDMWKRISAYMFDKILLFTVIVGVAFLLSFLFDFDKYSAIQTERRDALEAEYGIDLSISEDEYNKLSGEQQAKYDAAMEAFSKNQDVQYAMAMLFQFTLILTTFSVMIGYILLEFVLPLVFGNGQTLGKKFFGLGVMRTDGVRITAPILFIRTVLGKYTVETMVPLMILIGLAFGVMGIVGVAVLLIVWITNIILLIKTETRSAVHDMLASTVCIDINSQMIFESTEAAMEYKQRIHKEMADRAEY